MSDVHVPLIKTTNPKIGRSQVHVSAILGDGILLKLKECIDRAESIICQTVGPNCERSGLVIYPGKVVHPRPPRL